MYKIPKFGKSSLKVNNSTEGERIETKITRMTVNKEPINATRELIYTARKDGVIPAYDPRTDKMEIALDAATAIAASHIAKRQGTGVKEEEIIQDEPIHATPNESGNNE